MKQVVNLRYGTVRTQNSSYDWIAKSEIVTARIGAELPKSAQWMDICVTVSVWMKQQCRLDNVPKSWKAICWGLTHAFLENAVTVEIVNSASHCEFDGKATLRGDPKCR